MKTSAVLASLLFGTFAVAAPVDRRALVYKTEVVTETVVVYTTVYDDDDSVAQATTTPAGYFYEHPSAPSSAAAQPTTSSQAPAYTPPAEKKPSSTYVAPAPQKPTVAAAPSSAPALVAESSAPVETPKPVETPQPATSSAYVAPAPVSSAAPAPAPVSSAVPAPAPSAPASGSPSSGPMDYENVDITIYDNNGGFGACGTALHDDDMIVAIAKDAWGTSTYDVMTGAATNPWCGQQVDIEYNGNHITATIMDMCPGCSGHDLDLSLAAWKKLTNLDEKTRLKASWSKKNN